MAFTVVHPVHSQELWGIVEVSEVIHTGSIIAIDGTAPVCGLEVMDVAAGAANVTNLDIPLGVVTGNNDSASNKTYDTSGEYVTAASTWHDKTTQFQGSEGPMAYGVTGAMVSYIPITPETVIRGPIRQAAIGTALTVSTVNSTTTGHSTGVGATFSTMACTSVIGLATVYFRTGLNQGQYRVVETAHATTHTWTPGLPADVVPGDTAVIANVRAQGTSRAYIDSLGVYIDGSAALTSNYLLIDVIRLDLSVAGDEYVEFRFNPINFNMIDRFDTS